MFFDDFLVDDVLFENVEFIFVDGMWLYGWFVDYFDLVGIVLICYGNVGNIVSWGDSLLILNWRYCLVVMIFDYWGYGNSEGMLSEVGILVDVWVVWVWLVIWMNVFE